ncbi:MAG TPA: hypothetical protein VIZ90_10405 [Rhizobiaceae bacterium]
MRRALGANAYGRYTSPAKPRDEQIAEILDGVEKDGLERWLFAHLMARWVTTNLVRDIVDACPSIIRGLPDTTQLVQRLIEPIKQKLGRDQATLLKAADVRKEISDDLGRLADDIFVHGGLSRLQAIVADVLETYDPQANSPKAVALHGNRIRQLADEIRDEVSLLPDRVVKLPDEGKWVDEVKILTSALEAALEKNDQAGVGDCIASISRLLRKNFARVNRSLVARAEDFRTDRVAALIGEAAQELGFDVADIRPTLVGRALTSQIWQLLESELWLLADLTGDGEDTWRDLYKSWLELKTKVLWLAALTAEESWRQNLQEAAESIEDLMGSQDGQSADIKTRLNAMAAIIQDRFEPLSEQLKKDYAGLKPLVNALDVL